MKKTLNQAEFGKKFKIVGFSDQTDIRKKFTSLGILIGDMVEVTNRAPLGSPISVKHGEDNFFALRENYALQVQVEESI